MNYHTCVHHGLFDIAAKWPQKVALVLDDQSITYAEMATYVQWLALDILSHDVKAGQTICQLTDRKIREFQHMAQLELSMYKENLFEYFRFIRNNKDVLNELLTIASDLEKAGSSEKQKQLVQHLIEIKEKTGFVNVGYLRK
ncbi:unnamed protein product [Rotaria sp. Silwood1]|nr:unnamed protein product [Rotaria sp. Silwood1]